MMYDLSESEARRAIQKANRTMCLHRLDQAIALLPVFERDSSLLMRGIRDYLAADWRAEGSADRLDEVATRIEDDAATLVDTIRGESEALRDWKAGVP